MVMVQDPEGKEVFSISKQENILYNRIKHKINNEDSEFLMMLSGSTGSGKSLKAMRIAYCVDPTFHGVLALKRICFSKKEFVEAILGAKKGQAIIADEAISIFFSRAAMTKDSRLAVELLNQIRQKNLCVLVCIPDPLNLDSSVISKAKVMIQIWEDRKLLNGRKVSYKGNSAYYIDMKSGRRKTLMIQYMRSIKSNINRKIFRPYPQIKVKGNPITKMSKKPWYPVPEEAYRAKKESVLEKYQDSKPEKKTKMQMHEDRALVARNKLIKIISEKKVLSARQISSEIGLSRTTIRDILRH